MPDDSIDATQGAVGSAPVPVPVGTARAVPGAPAHAQGRTGAPETDPLTLPAPEFAALSEMWGQWCRVVEQATREAVAAERERIRRGVLARELILQHPADGDRVAVLTLDLEQIIGAEDGT